LFVLRDDQRFQCCEIQCVEIRKCGALTHRASQYAKQLNSWQINC
jgi:hypothetical protein